MKTEMTKLMVCIASVALLCAFGLSTNLNTADTKPIDLVKAEQEVIKLFKEEDVNASQVFKNLIINNPETMEYPFDKLQRSTYYISVIESSDGMVRIYRSLFLSCLPECDYNIFQYKSEGKVFTRMDIWFHAYICWNPPVEYVSDIKVISIEGKTYYLIFAGKYHCGEYAVSEFGVTAFTIEKNMLQSIPLFNYQGKMMPNLFVCALVDHDVYKRDYTIVYNENNKVLSLPETKDEMGFPLLTRMWLNYQLKGNHFEYIGKSGPNYLHESIHDFEYFLTEFDTKSYHHRIDVMDGENNKHRLSLWKKGETVDTKPDLVVVGIYDENKNTYIFEKDGTSYKYPNSIDENAYFIIEKNGKETLKEKVEKVSLIDELFDELYDF